MAEERGDLVVPTGVVREDGASLTYVGPNYPAVPDPDVLQAILAAAADLGLDVRTGITRSHDSFYTDDQEARTAAAHRLGLLCSDMETATLFVAGSLRGARCGSILNVVVAYEADLAEGISDLVGAENRVWQGEENEIRLALAALKRLA